MLADRLGPVPTPDPTVIALRGAGCGGAHETAGRGRLAGQKGTVCVNGVFAFPAYLHSLDPATLHGNRHRLATVSGTGESDCTLVFHASSPAPPLRARNSFPGWRRTLAFRRHEAVRRGG